MTTSPESSSTRPSAGLTANLEAGLAAVKQGNNAVAINLLESALAQSIPFLLANRAQMGLIVAYEKMGEPQRAVDLCRSLQEQSATLQIQEWASRTLITLIKRHPELAASPQEKYSVSSTNPMSPVDNEEDKTGFVPLTAGFPAAISAGEFNSTGFVPYTSPELPAIAQPEPPGDQFAQELADLSQPDLSLPNSLATRASTQPSATRQPQRGLVTDDASFAEPSLYQPQWRQAERSPQWKPVGKTNPFHLIGVQIVTAIALYFTIQQVIYWVAATYSNALLKTMPRLGFRWVQWGPPTWSISFTIILLLVALIASRWLLDALLTVQYGLQPLPLSTLAAYSPETAQTLNRLCRKAGVAMPALGILPTQAPLAFSYGVLPQVSRTIVSQGLLDQLADDEIAAVYANEVGHLSTWTVPLMAAIAVVLQLPYSLYRLVSEWGNQKDSPISRACARLISALSYGLFWLLRGACLGLSRWRVDASDRLAANLTGNPNGYTRALLKIAIGTAKDVQQQGQTSYLLEGFELLTPLSHRIATPVGSLYPVTPLEPLLQRERTNPYGSWFAINNAHPPLGQRLYRLDGYARQWQLNSELDWPRVNASYARSKSQALTGRQWRSLLLQGAPYFGILFGLLLALGFSFLGWIGQRLQLDYLSWMAGDRTLIRGLPCIGFSLGMFLRVNSFFPDNTAARLPFTNRESPATVLDLLQKPTFLPLDAQTTQLSGKLLGRPGICNVLNQDLLLQTTTGLVKLHCTSRFGPLGNLFPQAVRPADLIQQNLLASGWFRQGSTSWVDVETLRTRGGVTSRSFHPIYATLAGAIAAVIGILIILNP